MKEEIAKANYKFHFVSDLHLGSDSEPNFLLFLNYLESLPQKKVTHLFLLGDIFDLWVADQKFFIQKYQSIVNEIKSLVERGVEVHYFEGNHDFHLKKYWQDEVGVYIYEEPQRLQIANVNLLLAHGDQIDQEDIGYLRLRKFFRSGFAKFVAFYLPGVITRKLGAFADKKSTGHYVRSEEQKKRLIGLIRNFAQVSYEQMPYNYCLTGHVHIKDEYSVNENAKSINLGTWLDEPSFYQIDPESSQFFKVP